MPIDQSSELQRFLDAMHAIENEERAASTEAQAASHARVAVLTALLSGEQEVPDSYDRLFAGAA
jgi:hypothetical protein